MFRETAELGLGEASNGAVVDRTVAHAAAVHTPKPKALVKEFNAIAFTKACCTAIAGMGIYTGLLADQCPFYMYAQHNLNQWSFSLLFALGTVLVAKGVKMLQENDKQEASNWKQNREAKTFNEAMDAAEGNILWRHMKRREPQAVPAFA